MSLKSPHGELTVKFVLYCIVRRFLGSIQYLAKLLPMLAELETPLRELTKRDVLFHWDAPQAGAFQRLKVLRCTAPVLAYYDVKI